MTGPGRGSIIVIDDDPTQRLIACRDLASMKRQVILPETVGALLVTPVDEIGLCVTDRWLGETWHAAAEAFIATLPEHVVVWEWTCDEWGQPLCQRVERVIHKRPGALLAAVSEWVTGKHNEG